MASIADLTNVSYDDNPVEDGTSSNAAFWNTPILYDIKTQVNTLNSVVTDEVTSVDSRITTNEANITNNSQKLNQDVLTTSNPQFNSVILNGGEQVNNSAAASQTFVNDSISDALAGFGGDSAENISVAPSGGLSSNNVQAALEEHQTDLDLNSSNISTNAGGVATNAANISTNVTNIGTNASDLSTHISDTTTHGTTGDVVGTSDTQTLTNKTFDFSSNTVTAAGSQIANTPSGNIIATTVQAAIDELESEKAVGTDLSTHTGASAAHGTTGGIIGSTDAQTLTNKTIVFANNTVTANANEIINAPAGGIVATNVQAAITELDTEKLGSTHESDTTTHGTTGDIVGVSDTQTLTNKTFVFANNTVTANASEIVNTPAGDIVATNVQAAITELDTEKLGSGHESDTTTHGTTGAIVGTTDTQTLTNKTFNFANNTVTATASQITNVASGGIAATNVQAAVNELDTEKLGSAHSSDTMTHGTSSAIAGISDIQTFANKTITAAANNLDQHLESVALVTATDGVFLVGNGTTFVTESADTARTSLGLGTGDGPTFDNLTVTNALSAGSFNLTAIDGGDSTT